MTQPIDLNDLEEKAKASVEYGKATKFDFVVMPVRPDTVLRLLKVLRLQREALENIRDTASMSRLKAEKALAASDEILKGSGE